MLLFDNCYKQEKGSPSDGWPTSEVIISSKNNRFPVSMYHLVPRNGATVLPILVYYYKVFVSLNFFARMWMMCHFVFEVGVLRLMICMKSWRGVADTLTWMAIDMLCLKYQDSYFYNFHELFVFVSLSTVLSRDSVIKFSTR